MSSGAFALFSTSATRWGWLILSTCLYGLVGYATPRDQFFMLLGLYALLMWGYRLRSQPISRAVEATTAAPDHFLFGAAVVFRLVLLLALPALSNDYARFIWDGRLLLHGINPFRYLPVELMAGGVVPANYVDPSLYQLLNSPNYYTVYPPLNQLLFALAVWISPTSLLGSVVLLRLPIILAELGTLWLLTKLLKRNGRNPNLALLYGLNPLVILELTGNVHFEALLIFFSLLAVYCWQTQRWLLSSGVFALAIATKLVSLIALPLVIAYAGWKAGTRYLFSVLGLTGLLFAPFFNFSLLTNMLESWDLYFRRFEFNASIYYVIREVGYWANGYDSPGRVDGWLFVITIGGLFVIAFARSLPLVIRLLWMLTFYLAMATTVHPWYIASLVAVSTFTISSGYLNRYVLLWSALSWLSYAAYRTTPIYEDPRLLVLEYGVVFTLFIIDTRRYLLNRRAYAQTPAEV